MPMRAVVRRGVRLGACIGVWPAGVSGTACAVAAFVFLTGGQRDAALALAAAGAFAALGSMAAGLALGAAIGFVLAIAPRRLLTRSLARGLLAGVTAGLPVALLSTAFLTGDGYTLASYPPSIHLVMWSGSLAIALVAAARSGDIADCGA